MLLLIANNHAKDSADFELLDGTIEFEAVMLVTTNGFFVSLKYPDGNGGIIG